VKILRIFSSQPEIWGQSLLARAKVYVLVKVSWAQRGQSPWSWLTLLRLARGLLADLDAAGERTGTVPFGPRKFDRYKKPGKAQRGLSPNVR